MVNFALKKHKTITKDTFQVMMPYADFLKLYHASPDNIINTMNNGSINYVQKYFAKDLEGQVEIYILVPTNPKKVDKYFGIKNKMTFARFQTTAKLTGLNKFYKLSSFIVFFSKFINLKD
jgi:hypothetical protein